MLTWRIIIGMMLVTIVACGGNEDPLKEEMPDPSTATSEPHFTPITDITLILGTWRLKSIVTFSDDGKTRQDADAVAFDLTFKPDGTFEATHSVPIQMVTNAAILASKGLQHILQHVKEIVLTFQGEYEISVNQIKLTLLSADVAPIEAPEIDSDFENPMFYPLVRQVGDTRELNYTVAEDDSTLVFWAEIGRFSTEINYRRLKTD